MKRYLFVAGFAICMIALTVAAAPTVRWPEPPPLYSPFLPTPTSPGRVLEDAEAYVVIEALLAWVMPVNLTVSPIIVRPFPDKYWPLSLPPGMPPDWISVVEDVREANRVMWSLDLGWYPKPPWQAAGPDDLLNEMTHRGEHPAIYVSVPGFNPERTRALIYFAQPGGIDCCSGWVAFEKISGGWQEIVPKGWSMRNGY